MNNSIGLKHNFTSLIKFAMPTMLMMLLLSLYTIVDGIFVARFVGTNAVSAINIIMPVVSVISGIGIMFATGGSAVVARLLGQGENKKAMGIFTFIVISACIIGVVVMIGGVIFINQLITLLGTTQVLRSYCYDYGVYILLFAPIAILKMLFDCFFVTAGKPNVGLICSIIGGITNVVFDYLFIVPMGMGIKGAAIATGLGQLFPCIIGIYFFINKNNGLYFTKPEFDIKLLIFSALNGSSEMVTNLSMGVTTYLFNMAMIKYIGEDGVASISIICYIQFLMMSLYLGFTSGVAPVISYNYGKGDKKQLTKTIRYCCIDIAVVSVITYIAILFSGAFLIGIFVPTGSNVYDISYHGLKLFAVSFIFVGANIFASGMFTAFSNGAVSAFLSILKNLLFVIAAIAILPIFWGIDGIWFSIPAAEILSFILSAVFFILYRKKYGY